MKTVAFFITYLFLSLVTIQAQPFAEAPRLSKQKVKEVIEWIRLDFEEKAKEGGVSNFDKQGNLIAYFNKRIFPKQQINCKYDAQNRITEKIEWFDSDQMITLYAYKKNQIIEETKFRGKTYKTFFYTNKKNQVVEKKVYTKGLELGDDFVLMERVIYHYNKKDSLTGEKLFSYDLLINGKSNKYESRKTLHYYNPKNGKRSKTLEYDVDGSLISELYFEYDNLKRLTKSLCHFKIDNSFISTEIKYKNDKIWQSIAERPGYKDVKIYVDGRLIRLRSYNEEKIMRIVDYQYVYY